MPAALGHIDAIVLILMFCIFLYTTALDLMQSRRQDPLFVDIRESPIVVTPEKGRFGWLLVVGGFVLLFVDGPLGKWRSCPNTGAPRRRQ
jgi:uncharacterized membrane protein YfcA